MRFLGRKKSEPGVRMEELTQTQTNDDILKTEEIQEVVREQRPGESSMASQGRASEEVATERTGRRRFWQRNKKSYSHAHYRVYKRRWFGLAQLVLLNIVVSWDWLTFAPVSTDAATYFRTTESTINWLSTAFLFAFIVSCPVTIYALHRGPKDSIIVASVLLLVGNWIRYAGTVADGGIFGLVMAGQILAGFAQPFVLAAPTRYSEMWFTENGRIGATALASLANPFGGALAQLINPVFGSIPNMVLIISIISTAACIPSLFIPAAPPTPPTASSGLSREPIMSSLKHMLSSPPAYVVLIAFSAFVGLFNSFSSLLNQILYPYGYTEDEAGLCGAVLIIVGLVVAAVASPILDRTHAYLLGIKVLCPLISIAYLGMLWAPETRTIVAPYVLSGVLGAASFTLLPLALEYLVEITYPGSPEVSSTICWAGGQLLGGVFIVIMDELKDKRDVQFDKVREQGRRATGDDRPPGNMFNALILQATVAMAVLPLPMMLGIKRLKLAHGKGRLLVDEHRDSIGEGVVGGSANS